MSTVISRDGTTIAYDRTGAGPAVILVSGALVHRGHGGDEQLAAQLADHFTAYTYDRRGRGESGDTLPYAVEREIEDIEALIDLAGEPACVYGCSSGAALALEAALRLGYKIRKLALYEAPYNDDPAARQAWREYTHRLKEALAQGCRGDAAALFIKLVGAPDEAIEGMRQSPEWAWFEAVAPTLAYDAAALGEEAAVPVGRAARLTVPALVMDGGASFPFMHPSAVALARAMPNARHRTLEGQTHEVAPEVIGPALVKFFKS